MQPGVLDVKGVGGGVVVSMGGKVCIKEGMLVMIVGLLPVGATRPKLGDSVGGDVMVVVTGCVVGIGARTGAKKLNVGIPVASLVGTGCMINGVGAGVVATTSGLGATKSMGMFVGLRVITWSKISGVGANVSPVDADGGIAMFVGMGVDPWSTNAGVGANVSPFAVEGGMGCPSSGVGSKVPKKSGKGGLVAGLNVHS